jgi:SPP1 gp7 family putative phage head morphogenesis protein
VRPFQLLDGTLTREVYKAVLRISSGDDEAEHVLRRKLINTNERRILLGLREWLRTIFPGNEAEVMFWEERFANGQGRFRDVLSRALLDSVDLGTNVALDQAETIGLGFDYTAVNVRARDWAEQYTDDLLAQLGTTTRRTVGNSIARWQENGEPMSALIRDLRNSGFSQRRAKLIAATETTRAAAEANKIAYREMGATHWEWSTANDERVCPICGPLGGMAIVDGVAQPQDVDDQRGQRASLEGGDFRHPTNGQTYQQPPAHPGCRCGVLPVVD